MTNLALFHLKLSIESKITGVSHEQLAERFLHVFSVVTGIPLRKIEWNHLDDSGSEHIHLQVIFKRVQFRRKHTATLLTRLWQHFFIPSSYSQWKLFYDRNPSTACTQLRDSFHRGQVFMQFYERKKITSGGYDIFLNAPITDPNSRAGMGKASVTVVRNGINDPQKGFPGLPATSSTEMLQPV